VPVLAFAVGVYLPLSTMAAVFLGGVLRWFLTRGESGERRDTRRERGVLFGSGLVGGGGLTGVVLALWVGLSGGKAIRGVPLGLPEWGAQAMALATILALLWMMARVATRVERR
jgi:hypothetical protein